MNILKRLGRPISPHTGEDTSARADSMDASITFSGHLSQPWNAFHAASETRQSQHKSLKEIEYEVENSMNESNKSEIVIEYNEKEQELHHQVEKLDIVPQETDCKFSGVLPQESLEDFDSKLSRQEFDKVYQSGVSAVVNTSGELPQKKEVYEEFLMEACEMCPEKHHALKRRALQEIAELSLHVGVQRSKGLVAKDNTGTSDPYCLVALVHKEQVNKPHHDLAHWEEKKVVNTVEKTAVVRRSLSPEWNERFEFVVLDPKTVYLAVELWDSDDSEQTFSKTKGIEGFVNYIRDNISKKNDFLGKLYVPLQELPVEETTKWYHLVSHKGNPRGMIELSLKIHTKLPSLDEEEAMSMFTQLYHLFVAHERRRKGEFFLCWDGSLCQTAKEILCLQGTRMDLDKLQQAVCKTQVLFRNKVLYPTAVLAQVREIRDCRAQLDEEEMQTKPWVRDLMSSFRMMVKIVQDFIKDHQFRVNLKTEENVQMVGEMLQLMQTIYDIDMFVIQLDRDFAGMKSVIQIALQGSCARWYQKLLASHFDAAEAQSAQSKILLTIGALRGMMNFLMRSRDALQYHFNRVGVDYFQIVYLDVDTQLAGDLESVVNSELGKRHPTDTFILFDTVKAFVAMGRQLPDDVQQQLKLINCYRLFRRHVSLWIDERVTRFKQGMWKAVNAAEATPIVESVQYTTAVRDTIDLMTRVCSFWKSLHWPDPEESVTFLHIMTTKLCMKVIEFVDHMARKLRSNRYYLEEREKQDVKLLVMSEKICVHLNDIQQLRGALLDIPNYLEWEEHKASLSSLPREEAVSRVFEALQTYLESSDDDMHHKMVNLYDDICSCLEPSLRKAVVHVLDTNKTLEEALPFLMSYLTEMLTTLYQGLFHSVFKSILFYLWTQIVNICSELATDDIDKPSAERLFMVVGTLLSYFNSEGEGLARAELMQNKKYQELHTTLELRMMPTEKVVASYYHDLLEYQKTTLASRGSLSVVVGYAEGRKQLDFTLVKGSNLPPLDYNTKSSDPFAVIGLVPEHVFKGVKPVKTATHRNTLFPVFDTYLQLPVAPSDLSTKGAAVLIEVYDYELLGSNDVIGVALLDLSDVPTVSSTQDSGLADTQEHHVATLPLFIPVDSPALRELANRAVGKKDLAAHELVQKIRKLRSL